MNTVIVRASVRALTPLIALLAVVLLFRGHDAPGGGFIAALAASAAVVLRRVAFGPAPGYSERRGRFALFLGTGLLLAVVYGLVPIVLGDTFLEGAKWSAHLPVLGEVKLASSLIFDAGVFLIVLGGVRAVVDEFEFEGHRDVRADEETRELHEGDATEGAR